MSKGKAFPLTVSKQKKSTTESEQHVFHDTAINSGKNIKPAQAQIRLIWLKTDLPGNFFAQVLFSVPKKRFKTAVQRNRLRRRMREAYRKNKHLLYEHLIKNRKKLAMAFIYNSSEEAGYKAIEAEILLSLQYLVNSAD